MKILCLQTSRESILSAKRQKFLIKSATGALALIVLFVALFSIACIIHEEDHECVGEHCHICESIQFCENLVRKLFAGYAILVLIAVFFSAFRAFIGRFRADILCAVPFANKVRLNI